MKTYIISVHDCKAEQFGRPNFIATPGVAVRVFTEEVNRVDPQNMMNRYPEDYCMYTLGEFEDETAVFEIYPMPRKLIHALDVYTSAAAKPTNSPVETI